MSLYASISKKIRHCLNKDDKNSAFKLAIDEINRRAKVIIQDNNTGLKRFIMGNGQSILYIK
jgi:phosphoheptose isomerase